MIFIHLEGTNMRISPLSPMQRAAMLLSLAPVIIGLTPSLANPFVTPTMASAAVGVSAGPIA